MEDKGIKEEWDELTEKEKKSLIVSIALPFLLIFGIISFLFYKEFGDRMVPVIGLVTFCIVSIFIFITEPE